MARAREGSRLGSQYVEPVTEVAVGRRTQYDTHRPTAALHRWRIPQVIAAGDERCGVGEQLVELGRLDDRSSWSWHSTEYDAAGVRPVRTLLAGHGTPPPLEVWRRAIEKLECGNSERIQ